MVVYASAVNPTHMAIKKAEKRLWEPSRPLSIGSMIWGRYFFRVKVAAKYCLPSKSAVGSLIPSVIKKV